MINLPSVNYFEICQIGLTAIQTGLNFNVDCDLDLQGQAITLANDVEMEHGGGSITNEALTFEGGKVDE